eukprot:TRINITY_DN2579_c0_g2_i1.p1 TRINITY_DN2579_c0_g2~~TRINITY_DN2579_c0_g2_i1.p1  ORF type:complete len:759 (-),score=325.99 TRINITY_DN2579_c0_g2_i1:69-2345(-)
MAFHPMANGNSFWDNIFQEEDEAKAAEDGENQENFFSSKDAIVFLIDSTKEMFVPNELGEIPFHNAIKCAVATLTDKIISSDSDLLGICFYGTKNKRNSNEFEGVYVFHELDNPDAQIIIDSENLLVNNNFDAIGSTEGDFAFSDALWTCSTMFSMNTQKVGHRRIFLFTNEDDPVGDDASARERSIQRAKDLSDLGIDIELFSMNKQNKEFDPTKFYQSIITFDEDEDGAAINFDASSKFEELRARVRRKEFKKRSLARIPFHLGPDIEIAVRLYALVHNTKKGSFVWMDSKSNQMLTTTTKWVCEDTGTLLLDTQIKSGLNYGGEKVLFSKEDLSQIKVVGKVGVYLMGFKPKDSLKDFHQLRPSNFLYPDEPVVKGSTVTFAALLERMRQRNVIAICRFMPRITSSPKFVALVPQEETFDEDGIQTSPAGFHVIYLPYADDLREINVGPQKKASVDQINAAKKMVKSLRIKFDSRNFENPALQKHYAALQAIALDREEVEEVVDYVTPDEEGMAKFSHVIQAFKESVYPEDYVVPEKKTTKRKAELGPDGEPLPKKERVPVADVNLDEVEDHKTFWKPYNIPELKELMKLIGISCPSKYKKDDMLDSINRYFLRKQGKLEEDSQEVKNEKEKEKPKKKAPSKKKNSDDESEAPKKAPKPRKQTASQQEFEEALKQPDAPPAKKKVAVASQSDDDDFEEEKSKKGKSKGNDAEADFSIGKGGGEDWKPKPMCPYGANCYRKNADHLKEFRHPGKQK